MSTLCDPLQHHELAHKGTSLQQNRKERQRLSPSSAPFIVRFFEQFNATDDPMGKWQLLASLQVIRAIMLVDSLCLLHGMLASLQVLPPTRAVVHNLALARQEQE